jgi:hypothetical protein
MPHAARGPYVANLKCTTCYSRSYEAFQSRRSCKFSRNNTQNFGFKYVNGLHIEPIFVKLRVKGVEHTSTTDSSYKSLFNLL